MHAVLIVVGRLCCPVFRDVHGYILTAVLLLFPCLLLVVFLFMCVVKNADEQLQKKKLIVISKKKKKVLPGPTRMAGSDVWWEGWD